MVEFIAFIKNVMPGIVAYMHVGEYAVAVGRLVYLECTSRREQAAVDISQIYHFAATAGFGKTCGAVAGCS